MTLQMTMHRVVLRSVEDEDVVVEVVVVVEEEVVVVGVAAVVVAEVGSKIPVLLDRKKKRIKLVGQTIVVDSRGRRRSPEVEGYQGNQFSRFDHDGYVHMH